MWTVSNIMYIGADFGGLWNMCYQDNNDCVWIEDVVHVAWFDKESEANAYSNYAYYISDWDMDFIQTLNAENWSRERDRKARGSEPSYWFCQQHIRWHKKDVLHWFDANGEPIRVDHFKDPMKQIETCYKKYLWGTKFYGYYHRKERNKIYYN